MTQNLTSFLILSTVILMDILGGAEVDLFVPSFPEIQQVFNLTPLLTENLLSINFLGFCISLFFVGSLADYCGRRFIILIGLSIFTIGSLLCLFASSYELLLLGRFLQGVGVAAPAILCYVIIADLYPVKQQQVYLSALNAITNIAVAVAPIIGSFVTIYFHWQGNFAALLILGIITLIMTILFVPQTKLPATKEKPSLKEYIPILKDKSLITGIICLVSMFAHWWFFIGISPILYIEDLNVSLEYFGFYQGSLAFVFALGCLVASIILKKFDQELLLNISLKLCTLGLVLLLFTTIFNVKNPLLITLSLIPYYIGTVIPFAILYPICVDHMPESKGKVSAVIAILRLVFVALCLDIAGYFYDHSFQNIGIILIIITMITLVTLSFLIKNHKFMKY